MNIGRGVNISCDRRFCIAFNNKFALLLISSFINSNQSKVGGEGANYSEHFFKKFELVFAVSALSYDKCYLFCMSSVSITNITLTILVVFESRRFRKNLH